MQGMTPEKKRPRRNQMPDLEDVASASEFTGSLPAQRPECMPGAADDPEEGSP